MAPSETKGDHSLSGGVNGAFATDHRSVSRWMVPINGFLMKIDPSTSNAAFWNEPCGSHAARMLGVTDASIESLRKFDDWYLDFYPYLNSYIPLAD